jgi:ERCC4-type nuclease
MRPDKFQIESLNSKRLIPISMKITSFFMLILLTIGCSIGEKQVFYNEMFNPPVIELTQQGLTVRTENSKDNSALLIYKIDADINSKKKEINLIATQAVKKKYQNNFTIKLPKEVNDSIASYRIFWIDPDGKKNELSIVNAP